MPPENPRYTPEELRTILYERFPESALAYMPSQDYFTFKTINGEYESVLCRVGLVIYASGSEKSDFTLWVKACGGNTEYPLTYCRENGEQISWNGPDFQAYAVLYGPPFCYIAGKKEKENFSSELFAFFVYVYVCCKKFDSFGVWPSYVDSLIQALLRLPPARRAPSAEPDRDDESFSGDRALNDRQLEAVEEQFEEEDEEEEEHLQEEYEEEEEHLQEEDEEEEEHLQEEDEEEGEPTATQGSGTQQDLVLTTEREEAIELERMIINNRQEALKIQLKFAQLKQRVILQQTEAIDGALEDLEQLDVFERELSIEEKKGIIKEQWKSVYRGEEAVRKLQEALKEYGNYE